MNRDLAQAVNDLIKNYDKALNSDYVRNPIAWALYETWKKYDKEKK